MKVAVISNQETQQGRSTLMIMLAALFSKVQREKVILLSNEPLEYLLKSVAVKESSSLTRSLSVLKARIDERDVMGQGLLDYGIRIGEEEVYTFDVMETNMNDDDKDELLENLLNVPGVPLVLFEISGDIHSDRNTKLIERCDAVLNIYNSTQKSIDGVKDYMESYYPDIVDRTGFICQKFDERVTGEKKLAKSINMHMRNNMVLPYNPVIQKLALDGNLTKIARMIIEGHEEVIAIRPKILEIMQYLFDSPSRKYIKEVRQWPK